MDIFGQDIKLGTDGQAMVAANGELLLTSGVETGLQDIMLRLKTPLEELFYDIEFGALIHEWYEDENTASNRAGFEAEVELRIESDPRVELGTVSCSVVSWDETGFIASASFQFITEDHPFNLVINYSATTKDLVINDVNPRTGL